MAKVKYYAKENSTIGTHSFYAVPIPNGTLSFDELNNKGYEPCGDIVLTFVRTER